MRQLVQALLYLGARPAGLFEDPAVLGPDQQHGVEGERAAAGWRRSRAPSPATRTAPSGSRASWSMMTRGASSATSVTPARPRGRRGRCARPGHGAVSSRRSAKHMPSLPGWPCAARSSMPGRPPPTLRTTSCSARPAVIDARSPWPSTLTRRCGSRGSRRRRRPGRRDAWWRAGRASRSVSSHTASTRRARPGSPGLAARHHRVDGDLLDRRLAAVGRHDADDVLRVARRVVEHRDDALGRRRHDRQAVGQAALVERLERVLELADRSSRERMRPSARARAAPRAAPPPRGRA